MMNNSIGRISSLALALVAAPALMAQVTTGSISGQVKDNQGTPIGGVRVTVSSPALLSPRVMMTDAKGVYRAPMLPAGFYTIAVAKDGYVGSQAQNIRVGIGSALSQNLSMKPVSTAAMTVEVVGTSVEVDKGDAKVATNFSADALAALPGVNRGFNGAADLSAGMVSTANGGFAARGSTSNSTMFRVNGVDVKDDTQGQVVGRWYVEDAIEDVQTIVSPLHGRYGRALGGAVNAVTKTGGNEFAGSIRASLSRDSWEGTTPYTKRNPGRQVASDDLSRRYDVTFSGPILKDHLWFAYSGAFTPKSSSMSTVNPNLDAKGPQRADFSKSPLPAEQTHPNGDKIDAFVAKGPVGGNYKFASILADGFQVPTERENAFHELKLTGGFSADHTLEFGINTFDYDINGTTGWSGMSAMPDLYGKQTDKKRSWNFGYRGVLGAKTFIQARVQRAKQWSTQPTGNPAFGTEMVDFYLDRVAGSHSWLYAKTAFGLGRKASSGERNNKSGNIELKTFVELAGTHELDFGVDYFATDQSDSAMNGDRNASFAAGGAWYDTALSGRDAWRFPTINYVAGNYYGQHKSGAAGLAPVVTRYFGQDGVAKNSTKGFYVTDSWTVNSHWNAMIALRYDRMEVKDTDGRVMTKPHDWSPRFQVKYDLDGNSKHIFTLTAARLSGDINIGFTNYFVQKANSRFAKIGWNGLNQPMPGLDTDGAAYGVRWVTYDQLTDFANYQYHAYTLPNGTPASNVLDYGDTSKQFVIDPDLSAPYTDELSFGYRRSFGEGNFLRATYVYRIYKNDWAIAKDYIKENFVSVSDPMGAGLPDRSIQQTFVFNSNDLKRTYNSLELEWNSKLSPMWSLGGNYTYQHLVGNTEGGESPDSSFRDTDPTSLFSNRIYKETVLKLRRDEFAPEGRLANDQAHRARVWLTADVPFGKGNVSFSWLLRYDSGNPWTLANTAAYNMDRLGVGDEYPAAPGAFSYFLGGRGQYTTMDSYQMDFKMAWHLPLPISRFALIGDVKVNNLFNTIQRLTYNTSEDPANNTGQILGVDSSTRGFFADATKFGTSNPLRANYWNYARSVTASVGLRF